MQDDLYELRKRYATAFEQMAEAADLLGPEDYDVPRDTEAMATTDIEEFLDDLPQEGVNHEDFYSAVGVLHHLSGMLVPINVAIEMAEEAGTLDPREASDLNGIADAFDAPTMEGPGFSATVLTLDDLKDGDVDDAMVARLEELTGKSIDTIIEEMEAERDEREAADSADEMTTIQIEDVGSADEEGASDD